MVWSPHLAFAPYWLGWNQYYVTGWDRSHGLTMWQHIILSNGSLETCPRRSVVAEDRCWETMISFDFSNVFFVDNETLNLNNCEQSISVAKYDVLAALLWRRHRIAFLHLQFCKNLSQSYDGTLKEKNYHLTIIWRVWDSMRFKTWRQNAETM